MGGSVTENQDTELPYRQSYQFDPFGHMTSATNLHWGRSNWEGQDFDQTFTYLNNRIERTGWLYDADGRNIRMLSDQGNITDKVHDAVGSVVQIKTSYSDVRSQYDGNGQEAKRVTSAYNSGDGLIRKLPTKYFIRSTVLRGEVISEIWGNGKLHRSYIKGIGRMTAIQNAYASETATLNEAVMFEFSDLSGTSWRTTKKDGHLVALGYGGEGSPIETDPLGGSIGLITPFVELTPPGGGYTPDPEFPMLHPFRDLPDNAPDFAGLYSTYGSHIADLPGFGTNWGSFSQLGLQLYGESVWNATHGLGFNPNEAYGGVPGARFTGFGLIYGNGTVVGGDWSLQDALNYREGDESLWLNWGDDDDVLALDGTEDLKTIFDTILKASDLLKERVNIIGFTDSQRSSILLALIWAMINKRCVDSYRAANLPSPSETIKDQGRLIVNHTALQSPLRSDLRSLGITEEHRRAMFTHGNSRALQGGGFTLDKNLPINSGMPVITVLYDVSFNNDIAVYTFSETMVHEGLHSAGVTPNYAWWDILGMFSHDLKGYPNYDEIIENCALPEQFR